MRATREHLLESYIEALERDIRRARGLFVLAVKYDIPEWLSEDIEAWSEEASRGPFGL